MGIFHGYVSLLEGRAKGKTHNLEFEGFEAYTFGVVWINYLIHTYCEIKSIGGNQNKESKWRIPNLEILILASYLYNICDRWDFGYIQNNQNI